MPLIQGKLEVQKSDGRATTITLDGDNASIVAGEHTNALKFAIERFSGGGPGTGSTLASFSVGGTGYDGRVTVHDNGGNERVSFNNNGSIYAIDGSSRKFLVISDFGDVEKQCRISLGADKGSGGGKTGVIVLRDKTGNDSIVLDGAENYISIRNKDNKDSIILNGATGEITLNRDKITMDGTRGQIYLVDEDGKQSCTIGRKADDHTAVITLGADSIHGTKGGSMVIRDSMGNDSIVLDGAENYISIRNKDNKDSIILNGATGEIRLNQGGIQLEYGNISLKEGDIFLNNADCAEDFDFTRSDDIEPGTVVIIEAEGKLERSTTAYDKRVAGVISGAGGYKPGIVLDKKDSKADRKPVALMGKVFCKVDADASPIEVGDMLTSSSIAGYAMKAVDPIKAFGAVLGKALRPLKKGKGLIPILVTLQ